VVSCSLYSYQQIGCRVAAAYGTRHAVGGARGVDDYLDGHHAYGVAWGTLSRQDGP
jgi:hypothetical protein